MKFTKEEAFENLKSILTNNGKKPLRMSEISINKQLETLMPLIASEEMELTDFVGKVKDTFSVMNSNAEKDNSDFVKKWEDEHPVIEENKNDKKDEGHKKEVEESKDPAIAAILEKMSALENKLAESEKQKAISMKRKSLEEAMEQKGIKDKEWRNDFLAEISITEDMDIEAKADSFLKIYNKSKASEGDEDTSPYSSKGGNNNKQSHRFDYLKKSIEEDEKRKEGLI